MYKYICRTELICHNLSVLLSANQKRNNLPDGELGSLMFDELSARTGEWTWLTAAEDSCIVVVVVELKVCFSEDVDLSAHWREPTTAESETTSAAERGGAPVLDGDNGRSTERTCRDSLTTQHTQSSSSSSSSSSINQSINLGLIQWPK